ncbi:MAG: M48 family metallopeptidase [Deltaproteobacteria bacterium]|nr:M48 family metallopeptidase [Deltaproteobacteria bacterium]
MRRSLALALLASVVLLASTAFAQESTAARLPLMEQELAELREPVAVPEPTPEAVRLYRTSHWVLAASIAIDAAIPALILWSGLAVALRSRIERAVKWWPLVAGLFFVAYVAADWLLSLPFSYYRGFVRLHEYGLSNQSLTVWLRERAIGLGVEALVGMLVIWVPVLLVRKLPRLWWLATGALLVPFVTLVVFVKPIAIDPLTDDFGAMKSPQLEARILALAERAGIEGARVYEVNKSADTNAVNAYVTGFGSTKRIVLWDTLLAKLAPEQVLVVMGHEMGHYVLGHVVRGIVVYSALLTFALLLIHLAASAVVRRRGAKLGLRGLADPAALLPLAMLFAALLGPLLMPAALAYSRHNERESDRFGLEITRDNRACAEAYVAMQASNLGYPRPDAWVQWLRGSHPSLGERIDFCNTYRPWERGEALRYEHLFRE